MKWIEGLEQVLSLFVLEVWLAFGRCRANHNPTVFTLGSTSFTRRQH